MNLQQKDSFSRFGKHFQENLIQLMLEEREFCDQMQEVLDISFLELKHLQVLTKKIFEYRDKYGVHPSYRIVETIIKTELEDESEVTKKMTRDYFIRVTTGTSIVDDSDYIKEIALDFCKKQKLKEAIVKSVKLLQKSSFDDIAEIINDALKLGNNTDYGYDYIKDFERRFEIKARNPITTGWDELDLICRNGLGQGELGVVIAPTGTGKSMVLVHLGVQGIKEGKTVVHYTLELADTTVASRYDSCITGIALQDLFPFKEKIYDEIRDLEGTLIVKEYPTKSASTRTIKNHLEKLQQRGIDVGMIIVDYGDLLKPNNVTREKRHDLESIYEELRGIAQIFKCPVWTASQTNRSGLNAEVITMESISEAFNKCFVSDFIFSVSRTLEDKGSNGGRIFVAKNRNGPDGLVYPIYMDPSRVKIKVLQSTGETPGEIMEKSIQDQAKSLRNKYKVYKSDKKDKMEA